LFTPLYCWQTLAAHPAEKKLSVVVMPTFFAAYAH